MDVNLARLVDALRAMPPREKIPLDSVADFIQDHWEVVKDSQVQSVAVARMIRQCLKDPDLEELLKISQELRLVGAAMTLLTAQTPESMSPVFRAEMPQKQRSLYEKYRGLFQKHNRKLTVLADLCRFLKDLGGTEVFELPDVDLTFPGLP